MKEYYSIAVLGAGLMGHGIAQIFAQQGIRVNIYDPDTEVLKTVPTRVKGICYLLDEDPTCIKRIKLCTTMAAVVEGVDLVIEAASEKIDIKRDIFAQLVHLCSKETILASNTSVIPISDIARDLGDRDAQRVVGTHFWNPPYLIPLVEVIPGERTHSSTLETTVELLTSVGKEAVAIQQDVVVGNRLQHALWREAISMVDQGICDAATVDSIVKNTLGLRLKVLGPLENSDLIGLPLTKDIHDVVLPQLSCAVKPSSVLDFYIDSGKYGMSSGEGFYRWTEAQRSDKRQEISEHLIEILKDKKIASNS